MNSSSRRVPLSISLLTVLWFGSLWGATEALLGGLLHVVLPPTYPGRIMIVVAMALMAYAMRRTGSPWIAFGMALVAAPLKLFAAVVYTLPFTAPVVLNPAFAILAQGLAVSVIGLALQRVPGREPIRYAGVGAAAGGLQVATYVALVVGLGTSVYPAASALAELGTKYPGWVTTPSGIAGLVGVMLPWGILTGALGGWIGGLLPVRASSTMRPAFLAAGSMACLAIFFFASLRI